MGVVELEESPRDHRRPKAVGGRRTAANTSTNNTGNEDVREGEFRRKRVRSRGTVNNYCRTDHRRAKRSIGVRCKGEGRAVAEALHVHSRPPPPPPPRPFRSYATWTTATVVSNTKDRTVNTVTADRLPPPAIDHRDTSGRPRESSSSSVIIVSPSPLSVSHAIVVFINNCGGLSVLIKHKWAVKKKKK